MPGMTIYRVGPQARGPLYVSDAPNKREGSPAREPSKYLNGGATEKDRPKRSSDRQLQGGSKKDSDRAITPAPEAVHASVHLAPPGSLQEKQLCHLHTQLSLGQSCHRQEMSSSTHAGSLWCPTLCHPVDCGLPGFSVREGISPGENTGAY